MTIDFILPDIGEGIVECELLEWLVSEGDVIEEDQPVAEVMTDKATVQIPAMHSGTVTRRQGGYPLNRPPQQMPLKKTQSHHTKMILLLKKILVIKKPFMKISFYLILVKVSLNVKS